MAPSSILEIARLYGEKVHGLIDPRMVILFGSQAKGTARAGSDIDIAVVVDRVEGDFLDAEVALYRARRDIDDRIEPVLLELGDDPSGFLESILSYGEIVYQAGEKL